MQTIRFEPGLAAEATAAAKPTMLEAYFIQVTIFLFPFNI
jgi:hypothetical protein